MKKHLTRNWIMPSVLILISLLSFNACKKDNKLSSQEIIEKYALSGLYEFRVSPTIVFTDSPLAQGKAEVNISHDGQGNLRLQFDDFQAGVMPFIMSVDIKMKAYESKNSIELRSIAGENNFIAQLPDGSTGIDPDDTPGGIVVPEDALNKGLHSQGKSVAKGTIVVKNGNPTFTIDLEPNVGLPLVIKLKSLEKL